MALTEGDSSILSSLPADTKGSVAQFREFFALTPAIDILKLFVPHKAEALARILEGIESLADFNQRLCRHLAAHSALEPIHHFPKLKWTTHDLLSFTKIFAKLLLDQTPHLHISFMLYYLKCAIKVDGK